MIMRIWHGYTTPANADVYESLLKQEIFEGIEAKRMPGFRGIELLRRPLGDEVEFVTMMRFDAIENIKAFTGEDYEVAYVPEAARKVLKRFDQRSQHYEVRESRVTADMEEGGRLAAMIGRETDA
jgi:antibiotic biosynthesis monooxygenase (ABM) superfamily enzyme